MNKVKKVHIKPIRSEVVQAAQLTIVPLQDTEKKRMFDRIVALQRTAERYLAVTPDLTLLLPSSVLVEPLSMAQRRVVDELETAEIAATCITAQAEIARIPIEESGEKLVYLPAYARRSAVRMSFSDMRYPDVSGPRFAGAPQLFWVREGFAEHLVLLAKIIAPLGLKLHIEETFRPLAVQAGMFHRRVDRTRQAHPTWNDDEVMAEARSKTASTARLAAHMAGAAADVFLRDIRTGKLLDFGHKYPDGGAVVHPSSPFITAEHWTNRQTLQAAATLAGLALYIGEDWHVSFDDNLYAWQKKKPIAHYGPVKSFNLSTGQIVETFAPTHFDQFFGAADVLG